MKQRILSLLVAVALLCSFLPQFTLPVRADDPYSGTCGENLTWKFDPDTGTLTIAGSGAMNDFSPNAPWSDFEITTVSLPDGLTSIGDAAFFDYDSLASVTIPDSVTSIGLLSFYDCDSLASVTIPSSVTDIGGGAFSACDALTAIDVAADNTNYISLDGVLFNTSRTTLVQYPAGKADTSYSIPSGVTDIALYAFGSCFNLTSVAIPESVTIGVSFEFCTSLTAIEVASGNPYYSSLDGVLFNKSKTELILYPAEKADSSYTIPEDVTSIEQSAFSQCSSLTSVTIPSSVTSIGDCAFEHCSSLTCVTIPSSVTSIGDCAFYGCSSLASVTIPSSVTSIGISVFQFCSSLTSVTIPSSVTSIDNYAFYECSSLTSVIIPASVTSIGERAFGWHWNDETGTDRIKNFTIYGIVGTAAEEYAKNDGFKFVPLDAQSGFCDVEPGKFYYDPMLWALRNGITNGSSQTRFSPAENCTRAQVVTFLWRAMGKPEPVGTDHPFTDVADGSFYYQAVLWAVENGITRGTSATKFSPNEACNRGQVVTFLHRAMGTPESVETVHPFVDVAEGKFYYQATLWAVEQKITVGTDKTHFSPNEICTRGQTVTFLYRLLGFQRSEDEAVYQANLGAFAELMKLADDAETNDARYLRYAQAEAELLDSAVIAPLSFAAGEKNDSTTFITSLNLSRGNYRLSNGACVSGKAKKAKEDTFAAMNNRNFRKALQHAFDKTAYQSCGMEADAASASLRNMLTPPQLVKLEQAVTDAAGHEFPAGTRYGDMVQYYCDKLGCKVNCSDGVDGWYNPQAAREYLEAAKAELADQVSFPIQLDLVYFSQSEVSVARMNSYKSSVEGALGRENVVINPVAADSAADYMESNYSFANGASANYDVFSGAGWSADLPDPGNFLDCYNCSDQEAGYMLRYLGLF